jgi:hypothetical protein
MIVTVLAPDLFGGETGMVVSAGRQSSYQAFKARNCYRPATGGCNCGTCKIGYQNELHDKRHRKCTLLGESHSPATDVSRRMVCNLYQPVQKSEKNVPIGTL